MVVFYYDKSFEGLLSAVFDAYARRSFPDRLLAEGEPLPLFAQEGHRVATDRAKADRVWSGVLRRSAKEVCSMLMHVWLSELPGSDEILMRYLRKLFDSPRCMTGDFTDDDVLAVKKIAQKVARERLFLIQFTRFQKMADGTFFAAVSPQYNALPLSLDYFTDRFADQSWLIYDLKRRYGYFYDRVSVTEVTLPEGDGLLPAWPDDRLMAEDERLFQELWKGYFQAMTIRERINPNLQRQHMPRRFWKYMPEKR